MQLNRDKILIEIARKGLKTSDAIRLSGVSDSTFYSAVNGKNVTVSTAHSISRALGLDVAEIIERV